jgi:hypothetical protein
MGLENADWQNIVKEAREVEKMRLLNEQTDALNSLAGKRSNPSGLRNWDWKLIGWCLLIFAIGLPFAIWYGMNN